MEASWFAARLRALRAEAGLTQQELADRSGLKLGAIRALEQGANGPTWASVLALAKALGVDCTAFQQEPAEETEPRKPGRPRKQTETTEMPAESEERPGGAGEGEEKPARRSGRRGKKKEG